MMRTDQTSGSTTESTNPLWFLGQICANMIGTSWHLVTQHATSVTVSLIKIRVNKLHPYFGSRGSEVQILSPRPFKTMGYGLGRSPFFVVGNTMGNKWRANRIKSPRNCNRISQDEKSIFWRYK